MSRRVVFFGGRIAVLAVLLKVSGVAAADDVRLPRVLNDEWRLRLVASEPELVTPVSCRCDQDGRLYVVESHTHFPPADYPGPKQDRIWVYEAPAADGTEVNAPLRRHLFCERGVATMGLEVLDDGWVVVATRSEVVRMRDSDGDGSADEFIPLLRQETTADYPHNGLSGMVAGPDDLLYVGQGENLGEDWKLIAADGSLQTGGGEGGNIFRCTLDGSRLERVATGFWNPFGLCFDPAGRLWTVGNDPDARPPCRLLHVVPGGDYGFQFRFGRAGTNPLIAWDGELPGTLPMAAGTGEAPCAVRPVNGRLWVTSWGAHRIESFELQQAGASWKASMQVVVQGEPDFRPVDMAVAPDGAVYITDWADRSYPVHGKGRLWRLEPATPVREPAPWPRLSPAERQAVSLLRGTGATADRQLVALDDSDPFVQQAAAFGLASGEQLDELDWQDLTSAGRQAGVLAAWRWRQLCQPESVDGGRVQTLLNGGLTSNHDSVNIAAVRWAAETADRQWISPIRALLDREEISADLFGVVTAAVSYLESGSAAGGRRDPQRETLLIAVATDESRPPLLRALAIRLLPRDAEQPGDAQLGEWIRSTTDLTLARDVVALLADRNTPGSLEQLSQVVRNGDLNEDIRADALAGLVVAGVPTDLIGELAGGKVPPVLSGELNRIAWKPDAATEVSLPAATEAEAWHDRIAGTGDPLAGSRVFLRRGCVRCHTHSGRGARIGPDLTRTGQQLTRERLLESILQPDREVGPLFVPWQIVTRDGQVLTGIRLETSGASETMNFLDSEAREFSVRLSDMELLQPATRSIMPSGLEKTMSVEELRDLIAFLTRRN